MGISIEWVSEGKVKIDFHHFSYPPPPEGKIGENKFKVYLEFI